jgi:hypothetical protein
MADWMSSHAEMVREGAFRSDYDCPVGLRAPDRSELGYFTPAQS